MVITRPASCRAPSAMWIRAGSVLCIAMSACAAPGSSGAPTSTTGVPAVTATQVESAAASATAMPTASTDPGYVVLESTGDLALYAGTVYASGVEALTINIVFDQRLQGPAFSPTIIYVTPGQRLRLTFRDLDAHDLGPETEHDFTVTMLDLTVDIPPGGEASVDLTMPDSGALRFHCKPHFVAYHMAGEFRLN